MHFVSKYCGGERCRVCGRDATHKVEEAIFDDEPQLLIDRKEIPNVPVMRHPLTAYLCCLHYAFIMGDAAPCDIKSPIPVKRDKHDELCFCVYCMGSRYDKTTR